MRGPRLRTEALIVAYGMSRLDERYLLARGLRDWRGAFAEAAASLGVNESSIKHLRDEFDPYFPNDRRGWCDRPMRPSRAKVFGDLATISDDALATLVREILEGTRDGLQVAEAIASAPRDPAAFAARLHTGHLAEQYVLERWRLVFPDSEGPLVDHRFDARGFDFALACRPSVAIEVKGLAGLEGEVLFTDREWTEALVRGSDFLLVVVRGLASTPEHAVVPDPAQLLPAHCALRSVAVVEWTSPIRQGVGDANLTWVRTGPS